MEKLYELFSSYLRVTNSASVTKEGEGNVYVTVVNLQKMFDHRLTLQIVSEDGEAFTVLRLEDEVGRDPESRFRQYVKAHVVIPWFLLKMMNASRLELVIQTAKGFIAKVQQREVLDAYSLNLETKRVKIIRLKRNS